MYLWTHLANQLRHVLDMGDLLGLAIIQACCPSLISLHAVFNLEQCVIQ